MQETITITTSVTGAPVYIDNKAVGVSPIKIKLDRNKTYAVSATWNGKTGVAAIGKKISGAGVMDIVGGVLFLVPFVGCASPGFWDLDPKSVGIQIPGEGQLITPTPIPERPTKTTSTRH